MAYRLYLVPDAGIAPDVRGPKYFYNTGLSWGAMDYGFQPLFLVASDLPSATDTTIVAQPDVSEFPFDLTPPLSGGQVQEAVAIFEAALIPAQWLNATYTWREVARTVAGMFQYMQRLNGVLGNVVVLPDGNALNTPWRDVPPTLQTAMLEAAHSMGYDTSFIGLNTQIRVIFKTFSDAWGQMPFVLGGFVF